MNAGVPERRPVTRAVRTMLETVTARPVISHRQAEQSDPPARPYTVLSYFGWSGSAGPMWLSPDADVIWLYQTTAVGEHEDQAEALGDRIREAMVGVDAGGAYLEAIVILDDADPPAPRTDMTVMARWIDASPAAPDAPITLRNVVEVYAVAVSTALPT